MSEYRDFSQALIRLKDGERIARMGWNGTELLRKDMWLKLKQPTPEALMTLPYIYMCTAQGNLVPWLASQTDLLSEDWFVV